METYCAFCVNTKFRNLSSFQVIPHPICYSCAVWEFDVKEISFRSSLPDLCIKEIQNYNSEACKLYIKVSSEAGVLKISGPKAIGKEASEYDYEKALKEVSDDDSKTSSLAAMNPQDLVTKKVSENPAEDSALQISDHSKDLKTLLGEAIEEQSNKELDMKEKPRDAATESNCEEPFFELEELNGASKNIKSSRGAVTSSDIVQQQKEGLEEFSSMNIEQKEKKPKDFKTTPTNRKPNEEDKSSEEIFEKPPTLPVPSICVTDSSLDEKKIPIKEPLRKKEYLPEGGTSSIDKFVRENENRMDLNVAPKSPDYKRKLASLQSYIMDRNRELKRQMSVIARNIPPLEDELQHMKKFIPQKMTDHKFVDEIRAIHSNILDAESECGIGLVKNVTISLKDLDESSYLSEIYKKLEHLKPVYAVHYIERKQMFGRVSLMDGNILVHSLTEDSINKDCVTVWFKDLKKCFKNEKDESFIIYYVPDEGCTIEYIEPSENPLSQQFIKMCTGECGTSYKNTSLNKKTASEESKGSCTAIETRANLSSPLNKADVDIYIGNNLINCRPNERVVIVKKNGAFRIDMIGESSQKLSVVGKVLRKKEIWTDDSYVYVRVRNEIRSNGCIKDCGIVLKMYLGMREI